MVFLDPLRCHGVSLAGSSGQPRGFYCINNVHAFIYSSTRVPRAIRLLSSERSRLPPVTQLPFVCDNPTDRDHINLPGSSDLIMVRKAFCLSYLLGELTAFFSRYLQTHPIHGSLAPGKSTLDWLRGLNQVATLFNRPCASASSKPPNGEKIERDKNKRAPSYLFCLAMAAAALLASMDAAVRGMVASTVAYGQRRRDTYWKGEKKFKGPTTAWLALVAGDIYSNYLKLMGTPPTAHVACSYGVRYISWLR